MKYIVATTIGGLMECPEISYDHIQIIEANSKEEAVKIYNKKNNRSFFYGHCLGICNENDDSAVIFDVEDLIRMNKIKFFRK